MRFVTRPGGGAGRDHLPAAADFPGRPCRFLAFALTEDDLHRGNVVDFTATVDGKKLEVRTERIAVLSSHPLNDGWQ